MSYAMMGKTCFALILLGASGTELLSGSKLSAFSASQYSFKSGAPSLGTGKLLLTEMKGLISRKGKSGLDQDEVSQLDAIRALLEQSVLPGILEGHRESIEELMEFYQAVLDCQTQVSNELKIIQDLTEEKDTLKEEHEDCREREDFWYQEKEKVCTDFEEFKENIKEPEEVPAPTGQPAEMYEWLQGMSDYYCPIHEIFVEKWEECEEVTKNYTKVHEECTTEQTEYEELFCTLKTRLEEACATHETCWSEAVQRYEERKAALEDLFEKQKAEYEAAQELECLVNAFNTSGVPCVANETEVDECEENQPNMTNFTIDFPELPDPVECDVSSVSPHPCEDGWISQEYLTLGVSPEIIEETRENCRACADIESGTGDAAFMQSAGKAHGHQHQASFATLSTSAKNHKHMETHASHKSHKHKHEKHHK